jgi:hypothetical protein
MQKNMFECDGPECDKAVEAPQASGWFDVSTMRYPGDTTKFETYHATLCSLECIGDWSDNPEPLQPEDVPSHLAGGGLPGPAPKLGAYL